MESHGVTITFVTKQEVAKEFKDNQVEEVDFDEYLKKYPVKESLIECVVKKLRHPLVLYISAYVGIVSGLLTMYFFASGS